MGCSRFDLIFIREPSAQSNSEELADVCFGTFFAEVLADDLLHFGSFLVDVFVENGEWLNCLHCLVYVVDDGVVHPKGVVPMDECIKVVLCLGYGGDSVVEHSRGGSNSAFGSS